MIIYDLPLPPSVNGMFCNGAAGGKFGRVKTATYREWKRQAGLHMLVQGPLKKIAGPVNVSITISDRAAGDLDNRLKAILDLMVTHTVIEDDKKDIVRSIHMKWGEVEGARVEISAADAPWITRRNMAKVRAA
jgi:Holliday junction resolvase RusA-like endonuclease